MAENRTIRYKAGTILFDAGQGSDAFYIIKEGQVEILKTNQRGQKVPIAVLNSGEFLGEVSLLRDTTHTSTAVALTEVKVAKISKKVFNDQLADTPTFVKAVIHQLVDRLQRANETIRSNNVVDDKVKTAVQAASQRLEKKEAA